MSAATFFPSSISSMAPSMSPTSSRWKVMKCLHTFTTLKSASVAMAAVPSVPANPRRGMRRSGMAVRKKRMGKRCEMSQMYPCPSPVLK